MTRQFKTIVKDRLFYSRFEYCISFKIDEASCLRDLGKEDIDELIDRRIKWREMAQQRWSNSYYSRWRPISEQTRADLHAISNLLLSTKYAYKLVVSVNSAQVYTNDLALIDSIDQLPFIIYPKFNQAQVNRPKDTVILKNSPHKYRSYFRAVRNDADQKTQLVEFLRNQGNAVRLSPALKTWMDCPYTITQDYYFVDYSSPAWATMLSLVRSGIIRKTVNIIPG